jgi:hemerythrin-like domain-containing protein
MQITDALLGEHAVFHLLVEQLEDAVPRCSTLPALHAAVEPLAISLLGHARIEEEVLFAPYERAVGSLGPLTCLRHEHRQMDELIRALVRVEDRARLAEGVTKLLEITRRHLAREEEVMFAAARTALDPGTLERLGEAWARVRGVLLAP